VSGSVRPDRRGFGRPFFLALVAAAVVLVLVPTGSGPAGHPPLTDGAATSAAPSSSPVRFDSLGGWVSAGGSANRSGYTPLGGPLSTASGSVYCPTSYPLRTGVVAVGALAYVADVFGDVFAINRTALDTGGGSGTVVWRGSVGSGPTTPDVSSGFLVIGDADGGVTALDLRTGAVQWTRTFPSPVLDGIAVVNGTVYLGTSDGTVAALALAGGRTNWTAQVGSPLSGAVAVSNGRVFAATTTGELAALSASTGKLDWNVSTGRSVSFGVGPAVYGARVVLAENVTSVQSFDANNGTLAWFWNGTSFDRGDRIEAPPALSGTTVFVQTHAGNLYAINSSTGVLRWNESNEQFVAGYPVYSAPAATPTVVYVYDATDQLKAISLATGRVLWRATFQSVSYAPVAIDSGEALIGDETGCLRVVGRAEGGTPWPVLGTVTDANGTPLAGVAIYTGLSTNRTNASGGFFLTLPNGTYHLLFALSGYGEVGRDLTIVGPVAPFTVVLPALELYPLSGFVEDAYTGHGVGGVVVYVYGADLFLETVESAPDGAFSIRVPAGPVELSAESSDQHATGTTELTMPAGPLSGVVVTVPPTGLAIPPTDPYDLFVFLPIALLGAVGTTAWVAAARARRVATGLPPAILSRFARYVLQRLLLLPAQILVLLTVLYIFGTFLPAAASQQPVCNFSVGSCTSCAWSDPVCVSQAFGFGYRTFVWNLFSGNWGTATYGHLVEPAVQFLIWYAPDSIELGVVALSISAVAAYVLGLSAGWHRDRPIDTGVRTASVVGLLFPSFLVILALFTLVYSPFVRTFGDTPFGVLPAPGWFEARGTVPSWIGIAYNTSPTGFPLVDAAWHGAWAVETIAAAKTLLQAALISAIYVPVYLRYARNAVAQAVEEPSVVAARARGIPESTIRWRHTGRRVVPIFLLAFAATLPLYIGTQSLVEAMTNDPGIGTLLLTQMTSFVSSGFGFTKGAGASKPGNFYQVTIFLVVAVVLVGSLASEVLSRYLDPRAARTEPS
jgi:ABC-type dipeptide/oligopeptide/nickel transport system permease component/outer membrane protein assembly factor BamB